MEFLRSLLRRHIAGKLVTGWWRRGISTIIQATIFHPRNKPALIQHALKCFPDDTNITISGSSLADLKQETNSELLNLHCWLKADKLSLNVAKTESMVIGSRQNLLAESHNEINIKLEDQVISKVDHTKSLGLIMLTNCVRR